MLCTKTVGGHAFLSFLIFKWLTRIKLDFIDDTYVVLIRVHTDLMPITLTEIAFLLPLAHRMQQRKNNKQKFKTSLKLSRIVRKPDFCLGENKGADQLRGNREADQRLCFRYSDSIIPLLLIAKISSI